jgi:hypothetical protein
VGESDPGDHGGEFDGAGLNPAVTPVVGAVHGRDRRPGKGPQLAVQAGLVAFDRQYVVRPPAGEVVGVAVLGVQRRR